MASPHTGLDISLSNLSALIALIENLELNAADAETLFCIKHLECFHIKVRGLVLLVALEGLEPSGMALVWGPMVNCADDSLDRTPSTKIGRDFFQAWSANPFLAKHLEHFCIKSLGIGALDSSGRLGASGVALQHHHRQDDHFSFGMAWLDSITDLHTHILHNHRVPSSQHAPASVTEPASSEHLTSGVTTNRPKPQWLVEPPEGWEEHMFGLRDRRHSLTPLASSTGASHLPSPSVHQQGQIHNENTMMDKVQESTDDEDRSKSNNEEGSEEGSKGSTEGSDYTENKESSSDCEASGVHSPLPPSSLPADWTDDSGPNAEETMASPHQGHQMYWRLQKKGKGRALDTEDVDLADHGDHETPPPYLKKPGNLSKVVLEEIWAFAWDVKMTAQELGQWHGQSTHDILIAAGFGIKPSHTKINEANLFCSWYWATQPKPAGVNRDTLNNLITKEYNTLMQDIPKDDLAARREKLQAVYEWSESSSVIPANQSVKSIAARVNSTKTQFSGLAKAWSNLKDIEIIGAVMYVGQDPAGCQISGIFGGSEVIRNFINEHGVDVRALMDKCLRNGDGTEAGLLSTGSAGDAAIVLELHCHIKETPRDRNHRVFGSMMKEKLLAALKDLCHNDPQKVTWHWLLKFMWKYHLTIINWPCGVSPLGPGFNHKKLKAGPLHQLVVPYLLRKLGHMYDGQTDDEEEQDSLDDAPKIEIKCWNQDIIDIPDENPLKSEIPLVKAANGTILQKILDDPEWQKSCQERDHQWQDTEARQQCQLPFPSCKPSHDEGLDTRLIMPDLHHDPPIIPDGTHTREAGPSDFPALAPQYWDLHRDMLPSHMHTREPSPAQQPPPRQYEDSRTDQANYCDPGPSNILYNPAVPHWVNRGGTTQQYEDDFPGDYIENY
ncbi:hypothetical protein F5141DRAFT_1060265 [Pisolithus sp. B1]|nr:hypothetical protein F5141DRAFT_1060265 [Pisolithus sp. B1]